MSSRIDHSLSRRILRDAVRMGWVVPQPCETCGESQAEAHHLDYENPFKVKWLCRDHHVDAHEPPKSSFAQRVKQARREAGFNQRELAEAMGVAYRTIETWEQDVCFPRSHHLRRLAGVVNKPLSWFFEENEVAA